MSASNELRDHVLDTLWSLWHELGVSSAVPRRHSDDCIDPEPLIAFTAVHGDLDPRLRQESLEWVLRYGVYVSKARLKNVLADQGLLGDASFAEYAATLKAHGAGPWPVAQGQALPFRPRARSLLEDLSRPALLSLRIRALFGVGARAELVRVFLSRPDASLTAADLSVATSYRKRNILNEVEPLRAAGFVRAVRTVNADRFSLARRATLGALFAPLPRRFTSWTPTFALLHLLLELTGDAPRRGELQRAVDAVRLTEGRGQLFAAAGFPELLLPSDQRAWPAFLAASVAWARSVART